MKLRALPADNMSFITMSKCRGNYYNGLFSERLDV